MDVGLSIAACGTLAGQLREDQLAYDLANTSTPGYKPDQVEQGASGAILLAGGSPAQPQQVGPIDTQVQITKEVTNLAQAAPQSTGDPPDFAISGLGFFAVRTATGVRYTPDGRFSISAAGGLVDSAGNPVLDPNDMSAQARACRGDHPSVKVSILIAAGDGVAATMRCLASIARTVDEEPPCEVVLVDDGTSDGTAAALAGVTGDFHVIRNDAPRGIKAAWSQAAGAARGEYLVLLRHDAAARPGWMPALLEVLEAEGAPAVVRARTVARGPLPGAPACVAMRAAALRARSGAARAEAIERACDAAVEVPDAVIEIDSQAGLPPPPLPVLRDVGGRAPERLSARLDPAPARPITRP